MEKFMKLPWYYPFAGLMASLALILVAAFVPNTAILLTGIILLHISGWIFAIRFFLCGIASFGSVLSSD